MRIRATILLSLSFLVLQVSDTWAQQLIPEGRTGRNSPSLLPEDLRLTPEQVAQMTSIQRRYLQDMNALRNELLNRRYGLKRLLSDPTAKTTEIKAQQREVFALENQVQERILDYQLEVRDILTPQQFSLWVSKYQMPFGHGMHHKREKGKMHNGSGMGMMHE